jgi:hypothetical protein
MQFKNLTDSEKWKKLRIHLGHKRGVPTGAAWAQWLMEQYSRLPGAMQPWPLDEETPGRFEDLPAQQKLTKLNYELTRATESAHPFPSIPTPWVAWLLGEYDRLSTVDAGRP